MRGMHEGKPPVLKHLQAFAGSRQWATPPGQWLLARNIEPADAAWARGAAGLMLQHPSVQRIGRIGVTRS